LRVSDKEREVCELIIMGKSNTDIAVILHTTTSAIKMRVSQLMDKTGTENRTALALDLINRQLLP
jgi:DNA-binding NarL/FixJ family response regulator